MKLSNFLSFISAGYMEVGERKVDLIIEDGLGTNRKELFSIEGVAITEHRDDKSKAAIVILAKRKRMK